MAESERTLHVDIISPERPLFSGDASAVVAPGHSGEVGILPKHAPMVLELGIGEVRITRSTLKGDVTEHYAIRKGFLETSANKVIIITEEARGTSDVDGREIDSMLAESNNESSADDRRWLNTLKKLADRN